MKTVLKLHFIKSAVFILSGIVLTNLFGCSKLQKIIPNHSEPPITTSSDSISYAIGVNMGVKTRNSIEGFLKKQKNESLKLNNDMLLAGFSAVLKSTEQQLTEKEAEAILRNQIRSYNQQNSIQNFERGEQFLKQNATRPGVNITNSGLQYEILKQGTGPVPKLTDNVLLHYHGTLLDGTVLDSSIDRNAPLVLPVNRIIEGWKEALQLMPVGSKWKLYIPAKLAYGEKGTLNGKVGPNETLIFELELLEIK